MEKIKILKNQPGNHFQKYEVALGIDFALCCDALDALGQVQGPAAVMVACSSTLQTGVMQGIFDLVDRGCRWNSTLPVPAHTILHHIIVAYTSNICNWAPIVAQGFGEQ